MKAEFTTWGSLKYNSQGFRFIIYGKFYYHTCFGVEKKYIKSPNIGIIVCTIYNCNPIPFPVFFSGVKFYTPANLLGHKYISCYPNRRILLLEH